MCTIFEGSSFSFRKPSVLYIYIWSDKIRALPNTNPVEKQILSKTQPCYEPRR